MSNHYDEVIEGIRKPLRAHYEADRTPPSEQMIDLLMQLKSITSDAASPKPSAAERNLDDGQSRQGRGFNFGIVSRRT